MVNSNKTLSIIVTYNPVIANLKKSVHSLLTTDSDVCIVDNCSQNSHEIETLVDKAYLIKLDKNYGIAKAQNSGIIFALKNNYEYICLFDQDTSVPEGFVNQMKSEYKKAQLNYGSSIGLLAPNYYDPGIKEYAHFARLTQHSYVDVTLSSANMADVSFVVSSGSFFESKTFDKLGLFKEEFFIDQVDTEYSLRILNAGLKIIVTPKVQLIHTIGHRDKKKLLGMTIKPNYHSALRKFYIFRNGIKVVQMYGHKFPGIRVLMFKRFVHDFLGVVFFETNKIKKCSAMTKGIFVGVQSENKWKQ